MHIIYVSSLCTKGTFNSLFATSSIIPGQQAQKYHRLIAEGFVKNGIKVTTISAIPITLKNCTKRYIKIANEKSAGVQYNYLPLLNLRFLKNIVVAIESFFRTLKLCMRSKECIVVCDVLNVSVTTGALFASKIIKRNSIGIMTDIPALIANNPKGFIVKFNNYIIAHFSGYVFLTVQMNDMINRKNKPYIVIEGQVDINMQEVENHLEDKYPNKVCLYAGMIQKKYGIKTLVEAFILADIENAELHIYGSGDYEDELKNICKYNTNIKFFGVVPNDEVVEAELKATLLINPRPTNEEFAKYSFPSKNMEYMVSGTPVLTTKLPGMPSEYNEYVYLIDDEYIYGIANKLKTILEETHINLHKRGLHAKQFVINEKNNIIQSQKILSIFD